MFNKITSSFILNSRNIFFSVLFIFSLKVSAQIPANLPSQGLVAWYPFNGNTLDESGYDNHAILDSSIIRTKDRFGNANSAYKFAGSHFITIPPSTYTPFDTSFTISLWFRSLANFRQHLFSIDDGGQYLANLNIDLNDLGGSIAYWNSGGGNNITSGVPTQYTDGFWHNLVFTRENNTVKIYFDGVLGGTKSYSLPIGKNNPITLSAASYAFWGDMDDVAIYNRALTLAEIDTINDIDVPKLSVLTPISTDAYPVSYVDTITWYNAISVTALKIEYSLDFGNSWNLIADSVPANLHNYKWTTPNSPGNTCNIKISDRTKSSIFAISSTFLISSYSWQMVTTNAPFSVRDGAGAFSYKDSMYLAGGWNPTDPVAYPKVTNNEVWRSANGLNWTLISTGPWEQRHTHGCLVYNDKMWIVGGDELQNHWQKDVWNSTDGVNWNLISDTVPWGERMTHMTSVFDNKMWVMGGQKIVGWSNGVDTVFNDVWNSTDGINWNLVTLHAGWAPRAQIGGHCTFKNKMWILGGGTYNTPREYFNDVWSSSDGANWTLELQNAPWPARQYQDVIVYDSAMWIMDGIGTSGLNRDGVWYSYNGIDWHKLKGTPWPGRHASSLFNHDKSLWVVAGNLWNDVWRLNTSCESNFVQPDNSSVYTGDTAMFSVFVTKNNAIFQWQIDSNGVWQNLSNNLVFAGIDNDTLTISNCTLSNNNQLYRCIITTGLCSDTSIAATLTVTSNVGIAKNQKAKNKISIYPNPANDFIAIKVSEIAPGTSYQIFDIYGKKLAEGKVSNNFKINTNEFASGLYMLRVGDDSNQLFEVQRR